MVVWWCVRVCTRVSLGVYTRGLCSRTPAALSAPVETSRVLAVCAWQKGEGQTAGSGREMRLNLRPEAGASAKRPHFLLEGGWGSGDLVVFMVQLSGGDRVGE